MFANRHISSTLTCQYNTIIVGMRAEEFAKEKLAAEKAAIEESNAKQAAISSEIANKMIAVCKKKWAQGEHRCYCEKYISHAPKNIQETSTCSGS